MTMTSHCALLLLLTLLLVPIGHSVLQVEVATLGLATLDSRAISFIYTRPPMDAAVKELRTRYGNVFNLTHTYIDNEKGRDCFGILGNSDYLLSEWYYRRSVPADVYVFISPTCTEFENVNRLTAGWNILMLTSAATGSFEFRNKAISPTRVTTGAVSLTNFAKLLQNVLTTFGWRSIYMFVDFSAGGMHTAFFPPAIYTIKNMTDTQLLVVSVNARSTKIDFVRRLKDFRSVSRVFLFVGAPTTLRQFLVSGATMNMTNGEFVYIYVEFNLKESEGLNWKMNNEDDLIVKEAFRSLLVLSSDSSIYDLPSQDVCQAWINESLRLYNVIVQQSDLILNETIVTNPSFDFKNGKEFAKLFFNRSYSLPFTDIFIDGAGERIIKLVVKDLDVESGQFKVVIYQDQVNQRLHMIREIDWGSSNGTNTVPLNVPLCGYRGDQGPCSFQDNIAETYGIAFGIASLFIFIVLSYGTYHVRKWVAAQSERSWYLDVQLLFSFSNRISHYKIPTMGEKSASRISLTTKKTHQCAVYFNEEVYVNSFSVPQTSCVARLPIEHQPASNKLLAAFKQLRNYPHLNINNFLGLCLSDTMDSVLFISKYCQRGSLHDLFQRFTQFDIEHCPSLCMDFLEGMRYIHTSFFGFHGSITGWKCLIDSRFTLKISQLGFRVLRSELLGCVPKLTDRPSEELYWTAPEILRGTTAANKSTDMYSTGVVLYEILTVSAPFDLLMTSLEPSDIIEQICLGGPVPLRPNAYCSIYSKLVPVDLNDVICLCWDETPSMRPTIQRVYNVFNRAFDLHQTRNVVDNLLKQLEEYSLSLEMEVNRRSMDLKIERNKCDQLLHEILPRLVVKILRDGGTVKPEVFESVTVMFSDLYGFTETTVLLTPLEITILLNNIYTVFDPICGKFDVYKVETIGNVYMVASGVPIPNGIRHIKEICSLALVMRSSFFTSPSGIHGISFMAGIHTGSCAAGIMGLKNPRYCLFGDTVNTASRMGSHSLPDKIHMSSSSADLLENFSGFQVTERGTMLVKGKGSQKTFWLDN